MTLNTLFKAGLHKNMDFGERRQVTFANVIALTVGFLTLLSLLTEIGKGYMEYLCIASISLTLSALVIFFNSKKYYAAGKITALLILPTLNLAYPVMLNYLGEEYHLVHYVEPQYVMIALAFLPSLLFDMEKEAFGLWFSLGMLLIILLFYDHYLMWTTDYDPVALFRQETEEWVWKKVLLMPFLGIVFISIYIKKLNSHYEKLLIGTKNRVEQLSNQFKAKNEVLETQNNELEAAKAEIIQKNKILQAQAEELSTLHQEMENSDQDLEQILAKRTSKILAQKEKLISYASQNSHQVRGPLARVLGLTLLLKMNMIKEDEKDEILEQLHKNAEDLDKITRDLNRILEDEELQESGKKEA